MSVVVFLGRADTAVVEALTRELAGRGARMEVLSPGSAGLDEAVIPSVASMLARNGVIALALCRAPEGGVPGLPWVEIGGPEGGDPDSVLRELELKGLVPPPQAGLSEEEEALVRERLERLGYL